MEAMLLGAALAAILGGVMMARPQAIRIPIRDRNRRRR